MREFNFKTIEFMGAERFYSKSVSIKAIHTVILFYFYFTSNPIFYFLFSLSNKKSSSLGRVLNLKGPVKLKPIETKTNCGSQIVLDQTNSNVTD